MKTTHPMVIIVIVISTISVFILFGFSMALGLIFGRQKEVKHKKCSEALTGIKHDHECGSDLCACEKAHQIEEKQKKE